MATVCVLVTRLTDAKPGYIDGIIGGFGFTTVNIVDALSIAALELGSFVSRQLGDDQQVEEVAVEVGRLTEELGVCQDEAIRSHGERRDLGLGPRLAQDVADDRGHLAAHRRETVGVELAGECHREFTIADEVTSGASEAAPPTRRPR